MGKIELNEKKASLTLPNEKISQFEKKKSQIASNLFIMSFTCHLTKIHWDLVYVIFYFQWKYIEIFKRTKERVMIKKLDQNFIIINVLLVLSKFPQGSMNLNKFCNQLPTQRDTLIWSSSTNVGVDSAASRCFLDIPFSLS